MFNEIKIVEILVEDWLEKRLNSVLQRFDLKHDLLINKLTLY